LRIRVSLGNRETPKESSSNRLATPLQRHMRFPYPQGGREKKAGTHAQRCNSPQQTHFV
jgi:hypothetical protein